VKSIRVMEQVRKTEDLVSRAYDQSPVMSYGTYYAKRDWGTVPVEEDGSAHFRVPALREIYFQVLDGEGRELQRMTSALQVMPGERISCIGCHEARQTSPRSATGLPLRCRSLHGISRRPCGAAMAFSIFRRSCSRCWTSTAWSATAVPIPTAAATLTGDKTRYFSMAYDNLLGRSRSYRQHDMATGDMLPEEAAKGRPLVHFFWLLRTPTAVNRPLTTGTFASRLPEYSGRVSRGALVPLGRQAADLCLDRRQRALLRHLRP
jgi:hypothetical protein